MATVSVASVREALEAKKAEIEAALQELDRIDRDMNRLEAIAGLRAPSPPQINGKSYSQAVFDALSDRPRSSDELCQELGLTSLQVFHAVNTHRLRKIVRRKTIDGQICYYLMPALIGSANQSLSQGIFQLLSEATGPMSAGDIAEALKGKVQTNASNFHATVASTLSTLHRAKRIRKKIGGGYYISTEPHPENSP